VISVYYHPTTKIGVYVKQVMNLYSQFKIIAQRLLNSKAPPFVKLDSVNFAA